MRVARAIGTSPAGATTPDETAAPAPSLAPVSLGDTAARRPLLSLHRFEAQVGVAAWVPSTHFARAALSLELGVELTPPWRIALLGALTLTLENAAVTNADGVTLGALHERSFLVALEAQRCFGSTLRACVGLAGGPRGSAAWSDGTYVFQMVTTWTARPTFGLVADVAWLPPRVPLITRLQAIGLWNPNPASFVVAGTSASLSQGTFEALLALSFGLDLDRQPPP